MLNKLLRKVKRFLDPFFSKYLDTFIWRYKHFLTSSWETGYLDKKSNNHPHRELIVECLKKKNRFTTFLELGAGNGANLVNIKKSFPHVHYTGIDINRIAIERGKSYIKKKQLDNIFLKIDSLFSIKKLESKSIDYILTDAVLMYISPSDLGFLIDEIIRVTRFGFIMVEQVSSPPVYEDHWRHDYKKILKNSNKIESYSFHKISDQFWNGKWTEHGYIMDVKNY